MDSRRTVIRSLLATGRLTDAEAAIALADWRGIWARPEQVAPTGDWRTWLILAGRGWGKTRTLVEWIREQAESGIGPGAIVGRTAADVRDVLLDGPAGILATQSAVCPVTYEPSKRKVTWAHQITGKKTVALCFSAEKPDQLRGPQHAWAACDELAAWQYLPETWSNLQLGLRLGQRPRVAIATTPRPLPLLQQMLSQSDTRVTRGRTRDNEANLAPDFIAAIERQYAGTRIGRQELDGELILDFPGALWSHTDIEAAYWAGPLPPMQRIVIGVDPSGSSDEKGNLQGIVACGLGADNLFYVLADRSQSAKPHEWARVVANLFAELKADRVVAEANFGGAMVESVLRQAAPNLPITLVNASKGKHLRAEPIAALYEQGRVRHVPGLRELEYQMALITGTKYEGGGSPDRLDAMVWAMTELAQSSQPRIRRL